MRSEALVVELRRVARHVPPTSRERNGRLHSRGSGLFGHAILSVKLGTILVSNMIFEE